MDYIPPLSAAFFFATIISLMVHKKPRGLKAIVFVLVFLTALVRIEDISIASYISFIAGDLSPTTLLLLFVFLYQNLEEENFELEVQRRKLEVQN